MMIRNIIERHTYLYNQVFGKRPQARKEKDIQELLKYEEKEVEFKVQQK